MCFIQSVLSIFLIKNADTICDKGFFKEAVIFWGLYAN